MLSTKSYLSGSRIKFPFLFKKCFVRRLSLLPRSRKTNDFTGLKIKVSNDGHSDFTSPFNPLQYGLPKYLQDPEENKDTAVVGLGITNFFRAKNIFITGATGFFGKVLIEKILRSTAVGKVYILIRARDKEGALEKLDKEIIKSDLFERVRQKHGESFLREKMIPVVGNICEPNIGMDSRLADDIRSDVDIIIQSAAITDFKYRYDLLLDANVNAPQQLMRFAKSCKNLKLFAHISTAYVSGRTEGIILEDPLTMSDNNRLNIADEFKMAFESCAAASTNYDLTKNLIKLGQQRAAFLGWHNSYQLTKAMGELVLDEIRGDVPVVIIRPTIIESSYKEPFPGWIQGNRMCDPVIHSYGKGQLPAFLGNPQVILDVVPVDMVANTTIAAMTKVASVEKPRFSVYHVASSAVNPLRLSDFFEYLYEYFSTGRIKFFDNIGDLSRYTLEEISQGISFTSGKGMIGNIQRQCKTKAAYAEQLCKMYEFIGFFNARFDTSNTEMLMKEMSREERVEFEVDAGSIDWRHYIQDVHIPGLKKHVFTIT